MFALVTTEDAIETTTIIYLLPILILLFGTKIFRGNLVENVIFLEDILYTNIPAGMVTSQDSFLEINHRCKETTQIYNPYILYTMCPCGLAI